MISAKVRWQIGLNNQMSQNALKNVTVFCELNHVTLKKTHAVSVLKEKIYNKALPSQQQELRET